MQPRAIEPGLLRVFRYYCGFAVCYFIANFLYAFFTTHILFSPASVLFLTNFFIFLCLLAFLLWGWLERKLKGFYLPIAITIAAFFPLYTSVILWPLESQGPLTDIVYRSWMLFPILIVPIVLVAWQYNLRVTFALIILTAFYDLPSILISLEEINPASIPFIGVPILRSIAIGTVGTIVSLLMTTQRTQRKRLVDANILLSQHSQTLEQLAISRERNRLARELHDTLAHTLSSQILTLEGLRISSNPEDYELNQALDQMIMNTRKGLDDTRRALKDLRAKQLEDLGLSSALKSLVANAALRMNCSADCIVADNLPLLSTKAEQSIYRIAQEAVENIIRHSNATWFRLSLIKENNRFFLEISDNGQGFNQESMDFKDRLGIKGMKERTLEAGGSFKIESTAESGTTIQALF